ncbi:acetoin dehydrogenase dihydrolipoyllysine-residue acetyltransferase subunit [Paraburkholderia acidisoli]|uniref:Acetoin dehydrogenase dihydrolipoyllysine-residue acetyltransferase subunit n=1 Tax=Paraburkholderia acidisoli TaxID=2571748 RepID=A0A7Z2JHV3_9BURK|nr:acetoin dehydrogenase dihydrolipoyllysine-residue acetyltransferase subunit [Paraburkholderia acidisoli]QGZ65121.1 acetoin dehydrogenase dihydrolipoyllysine-residue acetyltransferase subunit [Paraburkholderia acidisoli]
MPTEVILPRVDMDMTEGAITAWYAKEGDSVRQGEPLFDIETSKATMEVEAPATGVVRQITAGVGETVPVGTVIAWIYASGEALQEPPSAVPAREMAADADVDANAEAEALALETATAPAETAETWVAERAAPHDAGLRATPAARRVARDRHVALAGVRGSGPHGRIGCADVLASLQASANAPATPKLDAKLNRLWLQRGAAATLVCLHGFAAEANSWRPLFNALRTAGLARDLGVLAIDLPGHGKSPADDALSLDRTVAALAAVLDAEQVDACHLVAHSFGGALAIALAASQRANVQSLTLIAPAGLGTSCDWAFLRGLTQAADRTTLTGWLAELVAQPAFIDEGFIASAQQQLASEPKRATLARIAETFFPDGRQKLDLRATLASLAMPVRVVWGARDRIMPVAHTEGLPGRVAQHRFADVGHMPQLEAAAEVARIIGEQLRR